MSKSLPTKLDWNQEEYHLSYSSSLTSGEKQIGAVLYLKCNDKKPEDFSDDTKRQIRRLLDQVQNILNTEIIVTDPNFEKEKLCHVQRILDLFPTYCIYAEQIPNEYGHPYDAYYLKSPWLIVTTKIGRIKIGRRKRVWSIDYTDSQCTVPAINLFPDEDVTRHNFTIHAWTDEKAKEYLTKIIEKGKNK